MPDINPPPSQTRVLVADDDPPSRVSLEYLLRYLGYAVEVTDDGERALEALLRPDGPKMAVLDWMMPGLDGPEVVRRIRERERAGESYTYLLLLTARGDDDDLVAGFEAGVDDYVRKPFKIGELGARLRVGHRLLELQERLRMERTAALHSARHDALTGALARGALMEGLQRELELAARTHGEVLVTMIDLDRFKRINDEHGHLAGDAVLVETTRRLQRVIRPYDLFGRFGGEEFVVVQHAVGHTSSDGPAERMRCAIEHPAYDLGGTRLRVTASFGVASNRQAASPLELLRLADEALYRAKRGGRNRVEVATGAPQAVGASGTAVLVPGA
ncbi:MAG TPA: diguanylate cyclase [Gemmatimonadaceae bacterium]|nr:diguanylate cyclase [Gemmatimonadaceae bacterium]